MANFPTVETTDLTLSSSVSSLTLTDLSSETLRAPRGTLPSSVAGITITGTCLVLTSLNILVARSLALTSKAGLVAVVLCFLGGGKPHLSARIK